MAKEKLDKFTTLISAFKVASDELSKLNLDTNDNGVEIKKDDENADKAELTSGQKSLVWEVKEDLVNAIADHFTVNPEDIGIGVSGNTLFIENEIHDITTDESKAIRSAKWKIEDNLQDYIWDITKNNLDTKDFLEMFVTWESKSTPVIETESLADYILEQNKDFIFKIEDDGKTYYVV